MPWLDLDEEIGTLFEQPVYDPWALAVDHATYARGGSVAGTQTRDKHRRSAQDYYWRNAGKIKAKRAEANANTKYYEANREKLLAKHREYYQETRETILAKKREYYRANRDRIVARRKAKRKAT